MSIKLVSTEGHFLNDLDFENMYTYGLTNLYKSGFERFHFCTKMRREPRCLKLKVCDSGTSKLALITLSCCSRRLTSLEQLTLMDCWMVLVLNSRNERLSITNTQRYRNQHHITSVPIQNMHARQDQQYYYQYTLVVSTVLKQKQNLNDSSATGTPQTEGI